MSGLCRLGVRSSNEKSLWLLGLFAHKFTRRIHTFGQAGGGRGTGIEPSPRAPEYCMAPSGQCQGRKLGTAVVLYRRPNGPSISALPFPPDGPYAQPDTIKLAATQEITP
jgi:hypothetical protein